MFDFSSFDFESIFYLICFGLSFVFSLVTFLRTGKINKSLFGGISFMANKDNKKSSKKDYSQSFDLYVTQYRLNEVTDELVELPDKLNLQEFINSSVTTCLQAQLEKLDLTSVTEADKVIEVQNDLVDKLDYFTNAQDYVDEMIDKYHLPADSSLQDVVQHLQVLKSNADEELKALRTPKSVEDNKNGGNNNG